MTHIQKFRASLERVVPLGKRTLRNLGKEVQVHPGAIMQTNAKVLRNLDAERQRWSGWH